MATEAQVIEYLRKLSLHKTCPERWKDWLDAHLIGVMDGGISLAQTMIHALDSGAELPEVPEPDEDEDEDEE